MGEVRNVQILGAAADAYNKVKSSKKTRKNKVSHGGGLSNAPPGASITSASNLQGGAAMSAQLAKTFVGGAYGGIPQKVEMLAPPIDKLSDTVDLTALKDPLTPEAPKPASIPTAPMVGGKRVLLAPKKKTKSVLHLAAPAGKRKGASTRKIKVHLAGMKKRLTQVKSIKQESETKKIEDIRKCLEEAKLIKPLKPGKKSPPEKMLRDIYEGYIVLRSRVL